MKTTLWLALNTRGTARVTRSRPTLYAGEIAVRMNLTVPDTAFQVPTVDATITIDDDQVAPAEVTADVIQTIHDAISATGLTVALHVDTGDKE